MKELQLNYALPDVQVDAWKGKAIDHTSYDPDLLITSDRVVMKPDGSGPLLILKTNCLPFDYCGTAFPLLFEMAKDEVADGNRGTAAGVKMKLETLADGSIGKRNQVSKFHELSPEDKERLRGAYNGVAGSLDRSPEFPYCRETEYGPSHDQIRPCLPFFQKIDEVFRTYASERWAAQMERVKITPPNYILDGTSFTTATINRNFQTAVHKDNGDLEAGFGVITCLTAGHFTGGLLVFPKYRVAVRFGTQDALLCDVHEWHANTPIVGVEGEYERLSCVLYFRENMAKCLAPAEELAQAKRRQVGDLLY